MILWFTGISGVGKTLIARHTYILLKKKIKNLIHVDGDEFRKLFKNDLGYSLKDRNKNAERIINFVIFLNKSGMNVIISANLTSQKYRLFCKKKLNKFIEVNITSNLNILKKRDKKNIYKNKDLSKVVGFGIKNIKNDTASYKIINNLGKKEFLRNITKIIKLLKKKII